jgi:hypothetical protein
MHDNRHHLFLSFTGSSDVIEHSFRISFVFANLIDCLLILEDVDQDFVFIFIVLEDESSFSSVFTCQQFATLFVTHVNFARPNFSRTLFQENLCNIWVDLSKILEKGALKLFLSDFKWHLQSNREESSE